MADYRDPKVTGTPRRSTTSWIGIVIALIIIALIAWWWWGGADEGVVGGDAGVTETVPGTTGESTTTVPTAPAEGTTGGTGTTTPPAQQ